MNIKEMNKEFPIVDELPVNNSKYGDVVIYNNELYEYTPSVYSENEECQWIGYNSYESQRKRELYKKYLQQFIEIKEPWLTLQLIMPLAWRRAIEELRAEKNLNTNGKREIRDV